MHVVHAMHLAKEKTIILRLLTITKTLAYNHLMLQLNKRIELEWQ
jgi:hypothetical protein